MFLNNLPNFSNSVVRSLLGLINMLCIVTSLIMIVFVTYDENVLKEFGDDSISDTADGNDMLLLAAVFMLFAGVLGCAASMQESFNLLYEYICVLIVMLALTLPISIYVFVQRAALDFKTQNWLQQQFYSNFSSNDATSISRWDNIQNKYGCCGYIGPTDFIALQKPILMSCCPRAYNAPTPDMKERLYKDCLRTTSFTMVGCDMQLLRSLQNDRYMLLGIGVLSFWFELAGVLTALCIAHDVKKSPSLHALFGS